MSIYYKVVCHDCKKKIDLPHYSSDFIAKVAGDWATGEHVCHSVSVIDDITGWDDEHDKLIDSTDKYEAVFLPEGEE